MSASSFVWYELMTTDAPAAAAFYADVVGWRAADSGMPGMDYTLLWSGDAMIGGLMRLPEDARAAGATTGWVGYVGVDDVDAKVAELQAAGGKLHRAPEDIPGAGRFAVVSDPHGATFCLFRGTPGEGEAPPAPAAMGAPGHVGWHELLAGDLDSAWTFYSALFGWTRDSAVDMGPMGTYQLFRTGGEYAVGGMMTRPPEVPQPGWVYYFNVDALDAAVERVKRGGGQVLNGPMEVPGGSWIAQGLDPQGGVFALVAGKR